MENAVGQVDPQWRDPKSLMPHKVTLDKPHNKEKSYKKYFETQCSDQCQKHLEIMRSSPPRRVRAYVHWHLHNKHKRGMYKPAPYLTHQSSPYQLELLRIRTQNTIHIIPAHLHYAFQNPRDTYQDCVCPYCLASGMRILGDELHIICQFPTTKVVLGRFTIKFKRLTRLFNLPSLTCFSQEDTTRLGLGNPPPQILHKDLQRWIQEATPLCCEFVYALRAHITSLQPAVVDMSSDDEDAALSDNKDDFSLILPPPWLPTCIHTTNHHHTHMPRPRRSPTHWTSYPVQMAHV